MEITCYRNPEVASESRFLPAATYNLATTLLSRSKTGTLFVPIRTMQYLAILDGEEFVFLDGERKCWVDIAWRHFKSHARTALDEPVAYEVVYYSEQASSLMPRLQAEFPHALQMLAGKSHLEGPARILKFPAP